MPTTFLVDDATNTPFTSGSAGVQVVVGTATSINGSPVGALAGLVGNFALDTSTNTLWACTASGTSGSAQWEQVLTDPSLYALINGSSGQVFNVADAEKDSEAINYGQAFQLLSGSPPASITLGNTLHTVAQFTLTASGSVTLEPGSVVGQEITIYGGAYALTVNSNVTSGSPYFLLPDESEVYSWTIPASGFAQGIRADWDGANWRAQTFGQTVVAPATQNNAAVQLGQFAQVFGANNTNGYVKLPNGWIFQWGYLLTNGSSSGQVITYPIAFPNAMIISQVSDQGSGMNTGSLVNLSNSQGTLYAGSAAKTYATTDAGWCALGY